MKTLISYSLIYRLFLLIFIFSILGLPILTYAYQSNEINLTKFTRIGFWQVREINSIIGENKEFILSKIARVMNLPVFDEKFVSFEIENKYFFLDDNGNRIRKKKYIILRIVVKKSVFENELLSLETCPIYNAESITLKVGDEDPIYIYPENYDTFMRLIGYMPFFTYRQQVKLSNNPLTNKPKSIKKTIITPAGNIQCLCYKGIPSNVELLKVKNVSPTANSFVWVNTNIPFGVVKRKTEGTWKGKHFYTEVQLLEYSYRGAFGKLTKVVKKPPFRSFKELFELFIK